MKIIGITGKIGSGKDAVSKYLIWWHLFPFSMPGPNTRIPRWNCRGMLQSSDSGYHDVATRRPGPESCIFREVGCVMDLVPVPRP